MPITLNVHHHHYIDAVSEVSRRLDDIEIKLDLIIKNQGTIMAALDDLTAQVAANTTVSQSALTLINGIAARITAAGTDPTKLAALTASLKSDDDALAAAVTANTPAA
jgi:hypothetical protein